MDQVEIREMQYVLLVSKTKSFSKAAKRCFISQPALSKIIKKVEHNLGIEIFDRRTSPLEVTPEGENILEYFSKVLSLTMALDRYCTSVLEQKKTDLIIGAASYFCTFIFPGLIAAYKTKNPTCTIRLIEANPHDLYTLIQAGTVDLGFAVESEQLSSLNSSVVKKETVVLAVPAELPINKKLEGFTLKPEDLCAEDFATGEYPAISLNYFEHEKFIFLRKDNDLYQRGMKMCRDSGFKPHIVMEMDQMLSAYTLASSGAGVTFIRAGLPHNLGNLALPLVYYKIDHPDTSRNLRVFTKDKALISPMQKELIDFIKGYPFPG